MTSCIWTKHKKGIICRVNHQAVMFNDIMFIFGGYSNSNPSEQYHYSQISICVWDTRRGNWIQLPILQLHHLNLSTGEECPEKDTWSVEPVMRYGHTVVALNGQGYLFGGRNDRDVCTDDVYRFDPPMGVNQPGRWVCLSGIGGTKPSARDGHAATLIDTSMFVFGGYIEETASYDNNLYQLDMMTWQWTKLAHLNRSQPWPRDFASLCSTNGRLFLYGGRSDKSGYTHTGSELYDSALWEWNWSASCWEVLHKGAQRTVEGPQTAPVTRRSANAWTYDNAVYVAFGLNGVRKEHLNDLWRFDLATCTWTEVHPLGPVLPRPRRRATAVVHPNEPVVFVFGGTSPVLGRELCRRWREAGDEAYEQLASNQDPDLADLNECWRLDLRLSLYRLTLNRVSQLKLNHSELPRIIVQDLEHVSQEQDENDVDRDIRDSICEGSMVT